MANITVFKQGVNRGAVFLCYNSRDRSQLIPIAESLKAAGTDVWIDDWQAGTTMQALAEALQSSASSIHGAVIFIGESGLGGWQGFEARLFARAHFERALPIVVALLPSASRTAAGIPRMLEAVPRVDLGSDPRHEGVEMIRRTLAANPSHQSKASVRRIMEGEESYGQIGLSADELDVELITKLHRIDDYEGGVEMLQRIVAKARSTLGARHSKVSFHLNELGLLFRELGRFKEAEASFRQAVEIDVLNVGEQHPVVASRLNNLALALEELGRFHDADAIYRRVIAIEEARGDMQDSLATTLSNLSLVMNEVGRFAESHDLLRRALAIDTKLFGANHSAVARDLANLSFVLHQLNRLDEAEEACR
jgi:hypothetical protein